MDKKTGIICSARNCHNKQDLSPKKVFFRFPAEPERAKAWASSCGRTDLLNKADTLHGDHRLCADHFENRMYTSVLRNHLKQDAQPTIFPTLETYLNKNDHDYTCTPVIQIQENNSDVSLSPGGAKCSDSNYVVKTEPEDIEETHLIGSKIFKRSDGQSANSDDKNLKKSDSGILKNLLTEARKDKSDACDKKMNLSSDKGKTVNTMVVLQPVSIQNTRVTPSQKTPIVTTTLNKRKRAKAPVKQRFQTIMPAMPVIQSPQNIIIVSQGIQKVIPIVQNLQAGIPVGQNNISTVQNLQKLSLITSGPQKIAPAAQKPQTIPSNIQTALPAVRNPQAKWPIVHVTPSGEKVVQSVPLCDKPQKTLPLIQGTSKVQKSLPLVQNSQAKWPIVHVTPLGEKVVQGVPIVVVNESPSANVESFPKGDVQCRTCGEIFKEELCKKLSDTLPHRSETLKDLLSNCVPSICTGISDEEYICSGCIHLLKICTDFIERCMNVDNALKTMKMECNKVGTEQVRNCNEFSDSAEQFTDSLNIAANKAEPNKPNGNFQCGNCSKRFHYFKAYMTHFSNKLCIRRKERKKRLRRLQREVIRREREERERRERELEEEEKRKIVFLCDICGKTFPKKRTLNSHRKTHWQCNNRTVCSVCGKVMSVNHIGTHMKHIHGPKREKVKEFMCDQCPKLFSRIHSLQAHRDFVHEKIEKYKCCECSKSFATSEGLKLHKRTKHSNERPYKCTACNVSFVRLDYYKNHFNTTYHKINMDPSRPKSLARGRRKRIGRPCICKYCNKVLRNEESLKLHYYTHLNYRPYKCSHCHLRFTKQTARNKHQKLHQGSDDHLKCDICYRKYPNEEELNAHRSNHEMRYICELCNEGFGRRYHFENHLAAKHSDNKEKDQIREILNEGIQYVDQEDDVKLDAGNNVVVEQLETVYSDEDCWDISNTEVDDTDIIEYEEVMEFIES